MNIFLEKFHIKHVSGTLKKQKLEHNLHNHQFPARLFELSVFLSAWTFLFLKQGSQEGKFASLKNSALWQAQKK